MDIGPEMVRRSQLRYRWEWIDLPIALWISFWIAFILTILSFGFFLIWLGMSLMITIVFTYIANKAMPLKSKVTPSNHPTVDRMCDGASRELDMKRPRVYLNDSKDVNAYSRGILSPIIVLQKGIIDLMDQEEVNFVIGHEMGHIKMRHAPIRTLFESSMVRVPLLLYPPMFIFRMLFLRGRLSRSMEFSADRAGLHATGDIRSAVRCIIKLSTREKSVDPEDVEEAINMEMGDIAGMRRSRLISRTLSTHPDGLRRIEELVRYSKRTGVGWPEGVYTTG
ncbi:MAG: M48 family metallopeptidase [Thermoplasmata archaeon]|nr:M48 family metallopeptidase [Thermoplasmata archaeon]